MHSTHCAVYREEARILVERSPNAFCISQLSMAFSQDKMQGLYEAQYPRNESTGGYTRRTLYIVYSFNLRGRKNGAGQKLLLP